MARIAFYRNEKTGELAPPHLVGTDEDDRPVYQCIHGWRPVDYDGKPVEYDCDYDGNWVPK